MHLIFLKKPYYTCNCNLNTQTLQNILRLSVLPPRPHSHSTEIVKVGLVDSIGLYNPSVHMHAHTVHSVIIIQIKSPFYK